MNKIAIEVVVKRSQSLQDKRLLRSCEIYLRGERIVPGTVIEIHGNDAISADVEYIIVGEHKDLMGRAINFDQTNIEWYFYTLDKSDVQVESEYNEGGQVINLAMVHQLPSESFCDLWENLVYDITVKNDLLKYARKTLQYVDKNVKSNIIACNRVVLLHGPPGTGKTSLCRALAHKLTIRMQKRYQRGFLLEINSHSLFSKWYSESGKLVTQMFAKVSEFLADPTTLVFVLIDEIESVAHARTKCISGAEPSDSVKVVNALLTQLDQIKKHPNVLILTTSNISEAIDLAFVDRADIQQYIGLPGPQAIYHIYYTCLQELMRCDIISPKVMLPSIYSIHEYEERNQHRKKLFQISELSVGLSGRCLRKIPLIADALFGAESDSTTLDEFFEAMIKAVSMQRAKNELFFGKIKIEN